MKSIISPKSFVSIFGFCTVFAVGSLNPLFGNEASATTHSAVLLDSVSKAAAGKKTVLIGEKGEISLSDKNKSFADLAAIAQKTLSDSIIDHTTGTFTVKELKEFSGPVKGDNADICIIIIGRKDFELKTPPDELTRDLAAFISSIKTSRSKIYVMPSAPSFGAVFNSAIQNAANETGAEYITMGTEVGGTPFEEAFIDLAGHYRNLSPNSGTASQPAQISLSHDRSIVDTELSRVAGDLQNVENTGVLEVPEGEPDVDFSKKSTHESGVKHYSEASRLDTEETTGGRKILRKTGDEAYETINMKPLPALKSFKPTIPVPRTNVQVKEPDLSRK